MKKRIISMFLCMAMLFPIFSGVVYAEGAQENACTHEHTEQCYTLEESCIFEGEEESGEEHVCTEQSGCIKKVLKCQHVHDETCGYQAPAASNAAEPEPSASSAVENGDEELEPALFAMPRSVGADVLQGHIVTDRVANPDGVTVNLFDYWVNTEKPTAPQGDILTKNHNHGREDGSSAGFSSENDWNRGINAGHLLLFGDGVIHGGLWNKGAGESTTYGKQYAGMEGIVRPVLENNYPVINTASARKQLLGDQSKRDWETIKDYKLAGDHLDNGYTGGNIQNLSETLIRIWGKDPAKDTESLDYLFDPEVNHPNKRTYQNIKGLFQIDDDGYYYYNMRENFAEFSNRRTADSDGEFILYDAPATVRTDAEGSIGNFFPFNKGEEVFDGVDANGKLTSSVPCSRNTMNHHLGMTINLEFRQPIRGMVNMGTHNAPMTFGFSGDDDVWVFIDGVLVLDLGGTHSEIYGTIDFSTGDVYIGRGFNTKGIPDDPADPANMVTHTTLRELFRAAGQEGEVNWRGNTFASNSDHTLQMFYLERGNYDSSLALRFNLQPRLYQQIKKVNQYGEPIEGVSFDLYAAEAVTKDGKTAYQPIGNALATLTTEADGTARFEEYEADGETLRPFDFTDRYTDQGIQHYILKETNTPPGYRSLPQDIVLEYNPETTMMVVVNRWTTGAYASFTSTITGNSRITYGLFDPATGDLNPTDTYVSAKAQKDGLVVAIPMLYQQSTSKWRALYGSNTDGLHAVEPENREIVAWRKAALKAVLYQCADSSPQTPSWFLGWSDENKRLEGTLMDLPGRADRYQMSNQDGDMKMTYAIIDAKVFADLLGTAGTDDEAQYEALGAYVRAKVAAGASLDDAVAQTVEEIYRVPGENGRGFSFLNVDQFNRTFRSLIYIPNEQRELRVKKVDQDGKSVNGAEFGLYQATDGALAAKGVTARVNGEDGVLIFQPGAPKDASGAVQAGYAEIGWARSVCDRYILKEISAPSGYTINDSVIPIVVGTYGIYADAGAPDNGITVMAGVGKLSQTMVKYASDGEVNITLRDITAFAQTQKSGNYQGLEAWEDVTLEGTGVQRTLNLHYGKNAVVDYGLHDEDGGKTISPFFVTNTGFLRTRVQQNYPALTGELYGDEGSDNDGNRDNLGDTELTSLFSLLNIVVVTDQTQKDTHTGQLTISKKVLGKPQSEKDYTRNFNFTVELKDAAGKPLAGEYYFYGTDKAGYIQSGGQLPLHHDESITILGLPAGTKYTVTEAPTDGWYTIPSTRKISGTIEEEAVELAAFINSREDVKKSAGHLAISKVVTGDLGDPAKEFHFTLTLRDENGNALSGSYSYAGSKQGKIRSGDTIALKHGERIVIANLPAGTQYIVKELEANQERYVTTAIDENGWIVSNQTADAVFVNSKGAPPVPGTGNLTVAKVVTGNGNTQTDFHFKVELRQKLSGTYGDITFQDGVAEVTLRHGQSKTATGLPQGTEYIITELEANQGGYETSAAKDTGTIADGEISIALFNNRANEQPPISPEEDPKNPSDNPPGTEEVPRTGDRNVLLASGIGAVLCLCALAVAVWRRKRLK